MRADRWETKMITCYSLPMSTFRARSTEGHLTQALRFSKVRHGYLD